MSSEMRPVPGPKNNLLWSLQLILISTKVLRVHFTIF